MWATMKKLLFGDGQKGKLVWADILKFGTMCSLLGTPHVRARPPRGPQNAPK